MADQTLAPIDVARRVYRNARQFRRVRKNPALSPLAASSESNVLLPVGETYDSLIFQMKIAGTDATEAEIVSQISRLALIVDGDTKIDISGDQWMTLQNYYQKRAGVLPYSNGCVAFDFVRPWHREITGEDGPAWGTADVRSFEMIVGLAAGATIDSIDTWRKVGDPENLGRHLCIRKKTRNFGSAATETISDWKREIGTGLMAIHVKETAESTLDEVTLTVDNIKELDRLPIEVLHKMALHYERTPQTGWCHIDFAMRNRLKDALPMIAQSMDLDIVWAGAPNAYTMLLEQIEGPADAE
jgi:hypothetical protein